jgi:dTDP-4-amino-4,6-dideoxygalactose transaminase
VYLERRYNVGVRLPTTPRVHRPLETIVPFVDLGPANKLVRQRVLERIGETIDRGDFTNGQAVIDFEQKFADFCRRRHCVGVSDGLTALHLSLTASGLARGAGVIVPASTFAATFEAVIQAGGVPVVVDIGEVDYCIDVARAEGVLDRATHLLPVHLYGQMADMQKLIDLAEAAGLRIIEDAAQAHGAHRGGLVAGSAGHAAAFSFYPTKNLGAMGDAGALVTDDEEVASVARALRVHGETTKYHHDYIGYTARLDTIQAIVLAEKLAWLEDWNQQRREAAGFYERALSGIGDLRLPPVPDGSDPAWHLFVVRTAEPERLATHLAERGVRTARHYPQPPHLAPAYRDFGYAPGDLPVAEALAREGLSLPIYPGISEAQLEHVSICVHEYFR